MIKQIIPFKWKKPVILLLFAAILAIAILLFLQLGQVHFPYKSATEHFAFHYTDTDRNTIKAIEKQFEENYARVCDDLKPQVMPKVHVKIYPDIGSFHKNIDRPDAPMWIVGVAWKNDEIRMVSPNNPGPSHNYQSMMQVIVHEFAHCVTENIQEHDSDSWNWLYESVAIYEAGQFRDPSKFAYMQDGKYPALKELNNNDVDPKVYDIGYTIIEYIKDKWGMNSVRELIKNKGDIKAVFNINTDEFEKGWYAYILNKYYGK